MNWICRNYGHTWEREVDDTARRCVMCGEREDIEDMSDKAVKRIFEHVDRQRAASTGDEP